MGLERSPLSLASTIEELLGRKNSGSRLEIREYGRRDPSRWPRGTNFADKRRSLGRYSSLEDFARTGTSSQYGVKDVWLCKWVVLAASEETGGHA
jgi:hypothetical protein